MNFPTTLLSLGLSITLLTTATAQTEKGRWTVGAQVGDLKYQDQNGFKSYSISLSPSAGYFVANGLVVGTGVPLTVSKVDYSASGLYTTFRSTATSIGLSPFVRYYIGSANMRPYVGISYSYSRADIRFVADYTTGAEAKNIGTATTFTPTVGVAYFITRSLALSAGLNYNVEKSESTTTYPAPNVPGAGTSSSDNKSVSLAIGFQLFLGK